MAPSFFMDGHMAALSRSRGLGSSMLHHAGSVVKQGLVFGGGDRGGGGSLVLARKTPGLAPGDPPERAARTASPSGR